VLHRVLYPRCTIIDSKKKNWSSLSPSLFQKRKKTETGLNLKTLVILSFFMYFVKVMLEVYCNN
jgi:hypothetical protein